jgi:undecaprenyl-diphosphatase
MIIAFIRQLDYSILTSLQQWPHPSLFIFGLNILDFLTSTGLIFIILSTATILLEHPKHKKWGLSVLFAVIATVFINELILKQLINRPRPFTTFSDITVWAYYTPASTSFPSGHVSVTVAVMVALILTVRSKYVTIGGILFSLLMIFSRMYMGVHYFSDVLGGTFIGLIIGALSFYFADFVFYKVKFLHKSSKS